MALLIADPMYYLLLTMGVLFLLFRKTFSLQLEVTKWLGDYV